MLSTSYSLFIVGSTSLAGALHNHRKGQVRVTIALLFGITSVATVFIIRKFLLPLIPERLFTVAGFTVTHSFLTMILFAALMILAARAMIRNSKSIASQQDTGKPRLILLLLYGVVVGLATGILGAGGGFLLIPTLVLFVGLPMKEAVGTSLFIIALNSLIGFTGDLGHFTIDWLFLAAVTIIATIGIITGSLLSKKINGEKLKKGFGWFVLGMAVFILVKEFFFL